MTLLRASLEIGPHHETFVHRRLACPLISALGVAVAVVARLAAAHPHARVAPGKIPLRITVRAANWISVNQLTVLGLGNTVLATRAIPSTTSVVRFDDTIELDVRRDGYAIVRVDGDRPMAPNVGDLRSFLVYPMAVANPIWI